MSGSSVEPGLPNITSTPSSASRESSQSAALLTPAAPW